MFAGPMLVAMAVDAALGWPDRLFTRIGHPVTWIGALIAALDRQWNREEDRPARRRAAGVLCVLATVGAAALPALALQALMPGGWVGMVLTGLLAWPLLALHSLDEHVAAVARPLAQGDLPAARIAVARIVGRDPARLDEAGVARAALESLAENASDGVVAPLFWGLLLGLPGIAAYKAINTLDSMIGHRTPRHEAFGWVAARLDDAVNLIPARVTALTLALASPRPRAALATVRRDARRHRSPNAGWPEAAMAGGLGIRLSGPRVYAGGIHDEPWVNAQAPDPGASDINRGLGVWRRGMLALAGVLGVMALA